MSASNETVHHRAQCKDIYFLIIASSFAELFQHFGRMVSRSSLKTNQTFVELEGSRAKIGQFDVGILLLVIGHYQDILRLQVTIDDLERVEKAQRVRHLEEHPVHNDAFDLELWLKQGLRQAALRGKLQDESERSQTNANKVYEVRVLAETTKDVNFLANFAVSFHRIFWVAYYRRVLLYCRISVTTTATIYFPTSSFIAKTTTLFIK